jgi:hypothetical protein
LGLRNEADATAFAATQLQLARIDKAISDAPVDVRLPPEFPLQRHIAGVASLLA